LVDFNALSQNEENEEITISLKQVPKMLGLLTREWAPNSFVTSFKLETDENLLLQKAEKAIKNYYVSLVIANLLHNRRNHCIIVSQQDFPNCLEMDNFQYDHINRNESGEVYIEGTLVNEIVVKHKLFMKKKYDNYFRLTKTNSGMNKEEDQVNDTQIEQLISKIYDQENTLMCKQIKYYLFHANIPSSTSAGINKDFSSNKNSGSDIPECLSGMKLIKHGKRSYTGMLMGLGLILGVAVIKEVLNR
jgi:hypothetical protein